MHESAARSDFLDQLAELIVYPIERCLCVSFNQAAGETVLPSGEWKYKKTIWVIITKTTNLPFRKQQLRGHGTAVSLLIKQMDF